MKKLLSIGLCLACVSVYATGNEDNSSGWNLDNSNHAKMMYFDFGLGVGTASDWTGSSLAIDAMTMGFYMNKNLGIEAGMGMLPAGGNENGEAMIMTYHLAAKGVLPLANSFSLYGKAGVGVNANEGEAPSSNGMIMDNSVGVGLYYAAGMQFNFNKNFAIYVEGSSVAIPTFMGNVGNNGGGFGSTYQGTVGLEARI